MRLANAMLIAHAGSIKALPRMSAASFFHTALVELNLIPAEAVVIDFNLHEYLGAAVHGC